MDKVFQNVYYITSPYIITQNTRVNPIQSPDDLQCSFAFREDFDCLANILTVCTNIIPIQLVKKKNNPGLGKFILECLSECIMMYSGVLGTEQVSLGSLL